MSSGRILIVDDDENICAWLEAVLSSLGMSARSVRQPLQVMEELWTTVYDVILLDVVMPGVSGLELLPEIVEGVPATKVIMMSGYADKESAIAALRLGAVDFLEKPFDIASLSYAVKRALESQGVEREHRHTLQDLKRIEQALSAQTRQLAQLQNIVRKMHVALGTLSDKVDKIQADAGFVGNAAPRQMALQVHSQGIPSIEKQSQSDTPNAYDVQLALLGHALKGLTADAEPAYGEFTPLLSSTELRIAAMIKQGMTTEEIAEQLHIALTTVKTHRRNIREKLHLTHTNVDLRSYLQSLERTIVKD